MAHLAPRSPLARATRKHQFQTATVPCNSPDFFLDPASLPSRSHLRRGLLLSRSTVLLSPPTSNDFADYYAYLLGTQASLILLCYTQYVYGS